MRQIGTTQGGRSWMAASVRLDPDGWHLFAEHRPQCFPQRDGVPHPLICAVELQEEFNRTIGWIDLGPPSQKLGTCCIDLLGRNRIYSFITGCTAHRDRGRIMVPIGERKPENFPSAQLRQSMARSPRFHSRARFVSNSGIDGWVTLCDPSETSEALSAFNCSDDMTTSVSSGFTTAASAGSLFFIAQPGVRPIQPTGTNMVE